VMVDEMVSILIDVIEATVEVEMAPPGSELAEFKETDFEIRHVHDTDRRISVFAGSTLLFQCSPAQWREVVRVLGSHYELG
jgi:hypothetical protein